jgi:hypothetical protein
LSCACAGLGRIEFADDPLAVPSQDGVRSRHIGRLAENLATKSMTDLAERGSLGESFSRPFNLAFRMRFSAARYSYHSAPGLIPVTKAIHSFSTASQFAIVCSKNLVSTTWRSYAGIGQLTPF